MEELSKRATEAEKYYSSRYDILPVPINYEKKYSFGNKEKKICRFCGKGEEEVTFKTSAHVLPELIGNKYLVSNYECDKCNQLFKIYDDQFSKWIGPERSFSKIHGKRGVPSYKKSDDSMRVDENNGKLNITLSNGNNDTDFQSDKKSFKTKLDTQTFRPRFAFKCLVKMGLSLLPEEELRNFSRTFKWLQISSPEKDTYNIKCLVCVRSFIPGADPFNQPMAILLRRKNEKIIAPYMYFFLGFSNYTFQIFIPFSERDENLKGKTFNIEPFPHPFEILGSEDKIKFYYKNLSQLENTREEKTITIKFDHLEPL